MWGGYINGVRGVGVIITTWGVCGGGVLMGCGGVILMGCEGCGGDNNYLGCVWGGYINGVCGGNINGV